MKFAFLRSINVGGRRVKNPELIEVFTGLGLTDVAAYQAAGNLVFRGDITAEALQKGLTDALGFDVPVLLRSTEQLVELAHFVPFEDPGTAKLQVVMLDENPADPKSILDFATPEDRLRLEDRTLYWLPSAGVSGSTIDWRRLEASLGLNTCRTQGTLQRMAKKFT